MILAYRVVLRTIFACDLRYDFTVSHETNSLPGNKMYVVRLKKFSLQKLSLLNFTCKLINKKSFHMSLLSLFQNKKCITLDYLEMFCLSFI
jgi:hypothetical protein